MTATYISAESLHITPLQGVVQLKPDLTYLDRADVGTKKMEVAANMSDEGGDTTESEGEEAKPVTVRFARPTNAAKAQKKVGRKLTFTENSGKAQEWIPVAYNGIESEEAEEERRLLFAAEDDQRDRFQLPEDKYLDSLFPKEASVEENGSEGGNGLPMSLEQIVKLPIRRQVSLVPSL